MSAKEFLLAVGVSLCLVGVVLRGLNQSRLRAEAERAKTARFSRVAGREDTLNAAAEKPHPLTRHLPLIYRAAVLAGAALTVLAYAFL